MPKIILHNDDVHSMQQVLDALMSIFDLPKDKALEIMTAAHNNGTAEIVDEPDKNKVMRKVNALSQAGLKATVVAPPTPKAPSKPTSITQQGQKTVMLTNEPTEVEMFRLPNPVSGETKEDDSPPMDMDPQEGDGDEGEQDGEGKPGGKGKQGEPKEPKKDPGDGQGEPGEPSDDNMPGTGQGNPEEEPEGKPSDDDSQQDSQSSSGASGKPQKTDKPEKKDPSKPDQSTKDAMDKAAKERQDAIDKAASGAGSQSEGPSTGEPGGRAGATEDPVDLADIWKIEHTIVGSNESQDREEKSKEDLGEDTIEKDENLGGEESNKAVEDQKNEITVAQQEVDGEVKLQKDAKAEGKILDKTQVASLNKRLSNKYAELLKITQKWVQLLRGTKEEDIVMRSDLFSRRVPQLLGRETDAEHDTKGKKVMIFFFDTSGSIDQQLLKVVTSDTAIKLMNAKVINQMCCLNIDGNHAIKFDSPKNVKVLIGNALRGAGSDFGPAWKILYRTLTDKKYTKNMQISGIVWFSDLDVANTRIPQQIQDFKLPMLFIAIPGFGRDPQMSNIQHVLNQPGPISVVSVSTKNHAKLLRPLKVK
jgi:ATP-dependent Clp protease adapter protein ClpS